MKKSYSTIAAAILASYALSSCGGGHDHDHHHGEGADHHHSGESADHDHDAAGHDHEKIVAGPNGGRILHEVEPHAEFFVTAERKIQITFVDNSLKPIAAAAQTVSVMAGDRSSPTSLAFAPSGTALLSDGTLPQGNDFPVVVSFKTTPDADTVRAKFNLNLEDCPTCDYKEYACTCDHSHDHGGDEDGH
ncbi:MAG: hypothetical protein P8J87_17485 [Verrucomicrobiales bacterium]|nr:hypothetical protein [Verrucomicrobiales bacterium]